MIDFFDKLYNKIQDKNDLLLKVKFYSLQRYLIRTTANLILPVYFTVTKNNQKYRLQKEGNPKKKLIVSLTSFPQRINGLWLVIESILRQSHKPDKIILYLSNEQFNDLNELPKKLLEQQKRGLEIKLVSDNLRSHKKYIYAVTDFPEDIFITIDDDVIYHSSLIHNLKTLNDKYPNAICCNRVAKISSNDGKIDPYKTWEYMLTEMEPSSNLMPIGIGGVLYPPKSLYKEIATVPLIKSLCFYADDIWLNAMARINNTKVAKTNYNSHYLPVINKNDITLTTRNVDNGENDIQLEAVRNYFIANYSVDPFMV